MGKLFEWKEEYNTGCDVIDQQHRRLFDIINNLFQAFEGAFAESQVPRILDELEDYTIYHFSTEEELFQQTGYPFSQAHIEEHKYFANKIKNFKKDLESGKNTLLAFDVMITLKDWLLGHILGSDKKYVPYLCKKD